MSWLVLLPIAQGIIGALGAAAGQAGLLSPEIVKWLLLLAGLPLTVQVPLVAHMVLKTAEKANLALLAADAMPLATLNLDSDVRDRVRSVANGIRKNQPRDREMV